MSEPMTDLDWWVATPYPHADDDWTPSARTGRHAYNEDATETPIFHALSTGAWNARDEPAAPARSARSAGPSDAARGPRRAPQRRSAPDPVDALTVPIPTVPIPTVPVPQAPMPKRPAARARPPHEPPADRHAPPHVEDARRAAFGAHALRPERAERVRPPENPERRERPERREVSDSGRHHRRRPSISSLL